MADDVVAELDRWLALPPMGLPVDALVRRARDEIVALRKTVGAVEDMVAGARAEALEEAARVVERYCDSPMVVEVAGAAAAKAIRALKDKREADE